MTIQPSCSISSIEFEPPSITFSNYSARKATFKIKTPLALVGSYDISFIKTESGLGVYYQDIPDQSVTLVAPAESYQIVFKEISVKSVGLPIPIEVQLSRESSRDITLLYSTNCT